MTDAAADYDRATWLFETKDYQGAAELLAPLAQESPDKHELRLLLARALYHSAQLGRAERELVALLERWPDDAYAHLLMSRTLQRAGRPLEARPHLRLAEAMGVEE